MVDWFKLIQITHLVTLKKCIVEVFSLNPTYEFSFCFEKRETYEYQFQQWHCYLFTW